MIKVLVKNHDHSIENYFLDFLFILHNFQKNYFITFIRWILFLKNWFNIEKVQFLGCLHERTVSYMTLDT